MKNKKGFTLLELLVVVSIIGILVALGAVSYSTAQKKGRDAKRKGDLRAIQNAMEQCYSLDVNYPVFSTGNDTFTGVTCAGGTVIMSTAPADPKNSAVYYKVTASDGSTYTICADLESDGSWIGTEEDECVNNLQ